MSNIVLVSLKQDHLEIKINSIGSFFIAAVENRLLLSSPLISFFIVIEFGPVSAEDAVHVGRR